MQSSGPAGENTSLLNLCSGLNNGSRDYVYSAIQSNEIRLFRGYLDKHEALIGEIRTFSIESADLPTFQAASYAWGISVYTYSIDIAGETLPILDSLYPFLRHVLDEDSPRPGAWWWIDSLCINQKDDKEKASQIPMMGIIFRAAKQTLVWLGEEADDSTRAIEFLHWIEKEYRKSKGFSEAWLAKVAPRDGAYRNDWEAVEKLFGRPWWTRVWTVQEFIAPERLSICCGKSSISRSLLCRALHAIWHCREKTLNYVNTWNRGRLLGWHDRFAKDEDTRVLAPSLTATMAYLGYHEATDPRDRIYSLSGIVKDFELAGVPDYNQPVERLYSNLVKSFVERYRSLDIICFATLFRSDAFVSNDTVPSWVPDWRVRATAMVGPVMVSQSARGWIGNLRPFHSLHCTAIYSASLGLEPRVFFSRDLKEITCQGFILDSIDGLAGLPFIDSTKFPRQRDNLVHSTSDRFDSPIQQPLISERSSSIMESIMRCLTLNRGDHYFNHTIPTDEYSQQFRSLLQMALASDPGLPFLFQAWFKSNQSFCICGWNFEALTSKWLENGGVIQQHLHTGARGSFHSRFDDVVVKMSRRLVVTHEGLIGMAPSRAKKGDIICILYGCSVPVVLRKYADGDSEKYTFIGECYVDGFMNGEALTKKKDFDKRSFRIV